MLLEQTELLAVKGAHRVQVRMIRLVKIALACEENVDCQGTLVAINPISRGIVGVITHAFHIARAYFERFTVPRAETRGDVQSEPGQVAGPVHIDFLQEIAR
eukprot:1196254-Prorocentrum_minimum.AAC.8